MTDIESLKEKLEKLTEHRDKLLNAALLVAAEYIVKADGFNLIHEVGLMIKEVKDD